MNKLNNVLSSLLKAYPAEQSVAAAVQYLKRRESMRRSQNNRNGHLAEAESVDNQAPQPQRSGSGLSRYLRACQTSAYYAGIHGADENTTERIVDAIDSACKHETPHAVVLRALANVADVLAHHDSTQ